jgi:phosphatidylserine/phosphatidylglycerophosphate/cardiolipin synthase-like enzyme
VTLTEAVSIIVEPNGNKASEVLAAINGAKKSIHMTMYLLDQSNIVSALEAQAEAGLDVKVILNNFVDQTSSGDNTTVYNELMANKVNVILSNPTEFTFTHEKCLIIDDTTAWIMTMNLETSAPEDNREYLAVDTNTADIAEAEAVFEADFANTQSYAASGPLVVAPDPPNNSRTALVELINSATKTLDVEDEEFSDTYSTGVTNAVAAAAKRGVKTRVVLANTTPTSAQTSSISTVKAGGASVVVSGGTTSSSSASNPYIHAKAIVVDCSGTTCKSGWIGSENMTSGSLGYNRELGVFIGAASELAKIETAFNTDFAAGKAQ